jgi:hypothetical protein
MNKIYTFGDGFATGHIWPEWPQILQALLPDYNVINTSAVGAGPEWLVHNMIQQLPNMANSKVIFQWPQANRFDKLIEDSTWQEIANKDPVYAFNQHKSKNELWWLSSASKQKEVQEYHNIFVQNAQHNTRWQDYKILIKHTLENFKCTYVAIDTSDQEKFSRDVIFSEVRLNEIQPSPVVHFRYLIDIVLPQLNNIVVDEHRLLVLQSRIFSHFWKAYDPDRDEIWKEMATL